MIDREAPSATPAPPGVGAKKTRKMSAGEQRGCQGKETKKSNAWMRGGVTGERALVKG